jgi:hypothetical protein
MILRRLTIGSLVKIDHTPENGLPPNRLEIAALLIEDLPARVGISLAR